jgi:hypothetical protein
MTEIERIDEEDYFRMNDVFSIWLINKQKVYYTVRCNRFISRT